MVLKEPRERVKRWQIIKSKLVKNINPVETQRREDMNTHTQR